MRWLNWMVVMLSKTLSQSGSQQAEPARHEAAVHQRPGVVGQPGVVPGDEAAERDLHEGEDDQQPCRRAGARRDRLAHGAAEPHERDDERGEEQAGERQVQRQLDRRHRRHARLKAGGDHDPADDALARRAARPMPASTATVRPGTARARRTRRSRRYRQAR